MDFTHGVAGFSEVPYSRWMPSWSTDSELPSRGRPDLREAAWATAATWAWTIFEMDARSIRSHPPASCRHR